MKRLISIFVLTAFTTTLFTQELLFAFIQESDSYSLAVLNISANNSNLTRTEARVFSERMIQEFSLGGLFFTMNQNDMERGLVQKNLDTDGCDTIDCAVRAGKALGVQMVVFGIITENLPEYTIELQMIHVSSRLVIKSLTDVYQGDVQGLMEYTPVIVRKLVGASEANSSSQPKPKREQPNYADEFRYDSGGGGFKWYYWGLGLLIAGGVGAGVVFAQKGSNGGAEETTPAFSDLPGPPSFP